MHMRAQKTITNACQQVAIKSTSPIHQIPENDIVNMCWLVANSFLAHWRGAAGKLKIKGDSRVDKWDIIISLNILLKETLKPKLLKHFWGRFKESEFDELKCCLCLWTRGQEVQENVVLRNLRKAAALKWWNEIALFCDPRAFSFLFFSFCCGTERGIDFLLSKFKMKSKQTIHVRVLMMSWGAKLQE